MSVTYTPTADQLGGHRGDAGPEKSRQAALPAAARAQALMRGQGCAVGAWALQTDPQAGPAGWVGVCEKHLLPLCSTPWLQLSPGHSNTLQTHGLDPASSSL